MDGLSARRNLAPVLMSVLLAVPPGVAVAADKVPFINDDGQRVYRHYVEEGFHRAFAISESGGYGSGFGFSCMDAAIRREIVNCEKRSVKGACKLNGLDGYTVRGKDPQFRNRVTACLTRSSETAARNSSAAR